MVFHVSMGGGGAGGLFLRWGVSFLSDGGGQTVRWGAPPLTMGNPVYYDIYILAFDSYVMVVE